MSERLLAPKSPADEGLERAELGKEFDPGDISPTDQRIGGLSLGALRAFEVTGLELTGLRSEPTSDQALHGRDTGAGISTACSSISGCTGC